MKRGIDKSFANYLFRTKRVHICYHNFGKIGWSVRKNGALMASRVYKSKRAAIKHALKFLNLGFDVVLHKKDGTVNTWEKAETKNSMIFTGMV